MSKFQLIYRASEILFKLAQSYSSQPGEIEEVIKGTGLFPVKPRQEKYDTSHPLHSKIIKILDDNDFPDQISISCMVTDKSQPSFIVDTLKSQNPKAGKVQSQIKSLLDPTIPTVYAALKKIPPPAENMTVLLFTL